MACSSYAAVEEGLEEAEAALEHGRRAGDALRRAHRAAATPPCAAQPQCMRLTVPPVRLASMTPAPIDAAIPMAWAMPSASRP